MLAVALFLAAFVVALLAGVGFGHTRVNLLDIAVALLAAGMAAQVWP